MTNKMMARGQLIDVWHLLSFPAARAAIGVLVASALSLPLLVAFVATAPPTSELALVVLGLSMFAGLCGWTISVDQGTSQRVIAVVLLVILAALGTLIDPPGNWTILFPYPAIAAGATSGTRFAAMAVMGVAAAAGATTWVATNAPDGAIEIGLQCLVAGAVGAVVARLLTTNRELAAARAQVGRLAVADERDRMARDLHDVLGQRLSIITLKAQLARRLLLDDTERAATEVADIEDASREALADVRAVVSAYRRPNLARELEAARMTLEIAGVELRIDRPDRAVDDETNELFAWAVREGVTNTIWHAKARTVWISVRPGDAEDLLEILNDGVVWHDPSSTPRTGSGLDGLNQRALALGGVATARWLPDGRFCLTVRRPRPASRDGDA